MTQLTDTLRDSKRLRLIATALELMQYERTDSAVIPIPGTEPQRYVVVGTAETVARLLEIAPAATTPTTQREVDERTLFEQKLRATVREAEGGNISASDAYADSLLRRAPNGDYQITWVDSKWEGWQARAAVDQNTRRAAPEAPATSAAGQDAIRSALLLLATSTAAAPVTTAMQRHALERAQAALIDAPTATAGASALSDTQLLDFLSGPAVVSLHQYEPSDGAAYIAIDLDMAGSPTVRALTLRDAIGAARAIAKGAGGRDD